MNFDVRLDSVMQYVVTGACDAQQGIAVLDIESVDVALRIFPCPAVDVRPELFMDPLQSVGQAPLSQSCTHTTFSFDKRFCFLFFAN